MNILKSYYIKNIIHYIIILFIILIPCYPIYYLKYLIFVPILLNIIWLTFNGCPLTDKEDVDFINMNVKYIFPNITIRQTDYLTSLILIIMISIIAFRFLNYDNKCKIK